MPGGGGAKIRFGESIAVGDFNGDGWDDVAIGAPFADASATRQNAGAVRVWYGALGFSTPCPSTGCAAPVELDGLTRPPDLVLFGQSANAQMGKSLANAGDLTHDADPTPHDELIVGGFQRAIVVDFELIAGNDLLPALTLLPGVTTSTFGVFVGSLEVAGERVIWVGDYGIGGTAPVASRMYFYREGVVGWDGAVDLTLQWAAVPSSGLTAATSVSDWDGDGDVDLAVGCSECSAAQANVKVWHATDLLGAVNLDGAQTPAFGGPIASFAGPQFSRTGTALLGFADGHLATGAIGISSSKGKVLTLEPGVALDVNTTTQLAGTAAGRLGSALAAVDINFDGAEDVVGGAPTAVLNSQVRGMVRFGNGHHPGAAPPAVDSPMFLWGPTHPSTAVGSQFGKALAVGDINGDGYDDLFIGAPAAKGLSFN
ncbi:MAG: FG-GAP repeat protein [Bradymonadia bacterium]